MPKHKQEIWVAAWNSAYASCTKKGDSDCESYAFATAYAAAKKEKKRQDDHPLGQLCPYQDCCHDLAFRDEGWYECPACGRAFYAEVSDSDYEDFTCHREDGKKYIAPDELMTAEDLGPSWATPDGKDRTMTSKIQRWIANLLQKQERKIKDVSSWDGSASNYKDTQSYCKACLVNVNSGSAADWTQDHCKLPVREDGDPAGTYVKQAVHAAAGGHGISQMTKPGDVSEEAWNSAIKKAANELISAYDEMGEQAPDKVYELAGKTPPKTKTTSLSDIFGHVYEAVMETDDMAWITDIYFDGAQMFCVIASEGKLYRADIMVGDNEAVSIGNVVEVKIDFPPVGGESTSFQEEAMTSFDGTKMDARRAVKPFTVIRQQANGRYRWISISCSAALDRMGEIDSRELFDSFIAHAEETGEYPIRQFYHSGETFRTGQADFLARDDALYITSGLYDETELARREVAARQKEPDFWGDSIGFNPTSEPLMLEVSDGISIPVYTAGINREISTLPENEACAWMTATPEIIQERKRMLNDRAFQAFVKFFDGDEAAAKKWLEDNSATRNRQIQEAGMITRQVDPPAVEPGQEPATTQDAQPATEPVVEPTPQPETVAPQLVLDEVAMAELVGRVSEAMPKFEIPEEITKGIEGINQTLASLGQELAEVKTRMGKFETLAQELAEIESDAPPAQPARSKIDVTYRPRQNAQPTIEKVPFSTLADEILASKKPIK